MFPFTAEQISLADSISALAKTELAPVAEEMDATEGFNRAGFKKIAEMGLFGITIDEAYGGSGLGATEASIAMEKLGEHCASTTLSYLAHAILCVNNLNENASEAQKKKYLPKLVTGEWLGGMGMTEPGAGSDALGMTTRAVRDGDHYILNGAKTFITNGPIGDVFVVYARTGDVKKQISTFIVEKHFPGFKVGRKLKKMGMRGSPTSELFFENCRVPVENLVGQENESVGHMMRNLNIERITISGISVGIAEACLKYTLEYATQRKQFGTAIANFQMIQERFAEMASRIAAARSLLYVSAGAYDRGNREMTLGANTKLFCAQMATWVGLEAIQILGGWGYMKEYPVERYMRDAKLMELGAGTNEVMRLIIAKSLLHLK